MIQAGLVMHGRGGRRSGLIVVPRRLLILRILRTLVGDIADSRIRLVHNHGWRFVAMVVDVVLIVMHHASPTNANQNNENDQKHDKEDDGCKEVNLNHLLGGGFH